MAKDKKIEDIKTIKECFDVILSGNKDESQLAARRVRNWLKWKNIAERNI